MLLKGGGIYRFISNLGSLTLKNAGKVNPDGTLVSGFNPDNYVFNVIENYGTIYIDNIVFSDNTRYITPPSDTTSDLYIVYSSFLSNDVSVKIENSNFKSNSVILDDLTTANFRGALLQNTQGRSGVIESIYNTKFIDNSAISTYAVSKGSVIYNYTTINLIDLVTFEGNYIESREEVQGGAIYQAGTLKIVSDSVFKNNYAKTETLALGGAIFNKNKLEKIMDTTFEGNYAMGDKSAHGGAIYNPSSGIINEILNVDFIDNYCITQDTYSSGGGIFNQGKILLIKDTLFKDNHTDSPNIQDNYGGAISNSGTIGELDNVVFGSNVAYSGGALINFATIDSIKNSSFLKNSAMGSGGAIYNSDTGVIKNIQNTVFENNSANHKGAAIENANKILALVDSNFLSNSASNGGGAINNDTDSLINIVSDEKDVLFENNVASNKSNAIFNRGTINLNSSNSIIIQDGIISDSPGVINLNKSNIDISSSQDGSSYAPTDGIIEINNMVSNQNINLYNGTLKLSTHTFDSSAPAVLRGQTSVGSFDSTTNFKVFDGILSTQDNSINTHNLGNLSFDSGSKLGYELDIDLANNSSDVILTTSNANGIILIKDINATSGDFSEITDKDFKIQILKTQNNDLQLELSDEVKEQIGNNEIVLGVHLGNEVIDKVKKDTNWDDEYYKRNETITNYGSIALATTDTTNDSLGFQIKRSEVTGLQITDTFDTLSFVNQADNRVDKNFNFDTEKDIYISTQDVEITSGIVNIVGVRDNNNLSTIDFKNNSGFEIANQAQLNIENTMLMNANSFQGSVINLKNLDSMVVIKDSIIKNNQSQNLGGAIYNEGIIDILADKNSTIIENNFAQDNSGAVYNKGAFNINSGDASVILNDKISGDNGVININHLNLFDNAGVVEVNNEISGNTINFYDGTLKFGFHKYDNSAPVGLIGQEFVGSFASDVNFNIYGGHITTQDGIIANHNLGNVSLNSNITMSVDANLNNKTMDMLSFNSFDNPNEFIIDINNINILEPTVDKNFEIPFLDKNMDEATRQDVSSSIVYSGGDIAYSPIYKYQVSFDENMGSFKFSLPNSSVSSQYSNFNPTVFSTPVSSQVGEYSKQLHTFNEAFYNMDSYMMKNIGNRTLMKFFNKYASVSMDPLRGGVSNNNYAFDGWLKPYASYESVKFNGGLEVDNFNYGTFFGTNSKISLLKNGWETSWGLYAGYNGARQKYDDVTIRQNGGVVGYVREFYKRDFFAGFTVDLGTSFSDTSSRFGSDDSYMYSCAIASKTGYNFESKTGKVIVQPNVLLSYILVHTPEYKNYAGVEISQDPLNVLHIEPGVRFILNLDNGFRPFAFFNVVWNILEKSRVSANDVRLPSLSIDPYVRWGVGVQKTWVEKFSTFLQTSFTNGSRNGVGMQFGVSWRF